MTHIEQRQDTSAGWASANPVLYDGELGWESNTRKSKLGDGVTAWNDLDYTAAGISATAADVGLDQVDNTADMDKPVSSLTQAALDAKAPLANPAFTGDPTAPTQSPGNDSTRLATTAFVQDAIDAAVTGILLAAHPVGSIEINVTGTNPSTYIGGTWTAWGTGRVPVGVDATQTEFDGAEETGGEKTHTLTAAEVAQHTHTLGGATGVQSANHTHTTSGSVRYADNTAGGGSRRRITAVNEKPATNGNASAAMNTTSGVQSASHTHTLPANTGVNSAGGSAHNNLQPYITCYMWKRTA
jgi:microcystin-dependent protein